MENLPKIVRDRLAAAAPNDHPDADLLTAFSESSLAPRERAEVMRHLAVCSVCREVISLALPQEERAFAVAVGMPASPPRALAQAPHSLNLRWAALAACAVIVAAATWILRPWHREVSALPPQEASSAKSDRKLDDIQLAQVTNEATQLSRKKQAAHEQRGAVHAGSTFSRLPEPTAANPTRALASTSPARIAPGDHVVAPPPSVAEFDRALVKMQAPAAPSREPEAGASMIGSTKPAQVTDAATEPALARQEPKAKSEAKDRKTFAAAEVATGAGTGLALDSTLLNSFMRWTLSDGKLRRSTDAGVNWEVVPIDPNSVFRALSVLGEELWVGGKKGVLYHSPDNGKHWVHVVPTAEEELLTEDIVRLEFADADHGKLITPHSEWTTENCGATWHRLQR
jgi:hypothetical protein